MDSGSGPAHGERGHGRLLHAPSPHWQGDLRLCGPLCGPPQRLRGGSSGTPKGAACQGSGSHDDPSLADSLTSPAPFAVTEDPSSLAAGSRPCVPSWGYVMPRASPTSTGPTAGLKWLEVSCSRSYARFTSPTHVGTGLRRCGLL